MVISIHALLAESDGGRWPIIAAMSDFYPRSPCGERRRGTGNVLAEHRHFYPRSPCGERPHALSVTGSESQFLSTLSLRRATHWHHGQASRHSISIHALLAESDVDATVCVLGETGFLSTLSLRRATITLMRAATQRIFLSTLSLRRATTDLSALRSRLNDFYPRSPCGERQDILRLKCARYRISIHALLAESDHIIHCCSPHIIYFYPRSPCGERLVASG